MVARLCPALIMITDQIGLHSVLVPLLIAKMNSGVTLVFLHLP